MAVEPTGLFSLPIHYLRLTIAGSETFQAWVGAEDAAGALDSVHIVALRSGFTLPFAVIDWTKSFTRTKLAGGVRNHFEQAGDLALIFRAAVDSEHSDAEAAYTFLNEVGAIVEEIEELAGQAAYLNINGIYLEDGPYRPGEDEEQTSGDYYEIVFRIGFEGS